MAVALSTTTEYEQHFTTAGQCISTGNNDFTTEFTVPTDCECMAIILGSADSNYTPGSGSTASGYFNSITWDVGGTDQACSRIEGDDNGTTTEYTELWYLNAPTTGQQTLRINVDTVGSNLDASIALVYMTGTHATTPTTISAMDNTASDGTNPSINLAADEGDMSVAGYNSYAISTFAYSAGTQLFGATSADNCTDFTANSAAYRTGGTTLDIDLNNTGTRDQQCLVGAVFEAVADTLDQDGFAFGDDDGSESAHTLDTADTNYSGALGTKSLRVQLDAAVGDPANQAYKLKYQKGGTGGYTDVPTSATTAGVAGPIEAGDITATNIGSSDPWVVNTPAAVVGDLLIFNLFSDDSVNVTSVAAPAGKDSETISVLEAWLGSRGTTVRGGVWYVVCTGTWAAGTVSFNPSAAETCSATVIKVLAGEFDGTTPIGTTANLINTVVTDTTIEIPAITAGSTDGGGLLVFACGVDQDPMSSLTTGWTAVHNVDDGPQSSAIAVRDTTVTDSEVVAEGAATWTIAGDDWVSFSYIVRPAADVTNEVYISASANVAAGGEATTARLTAPGGKTTGDFDTGRRWDDENGTDSVDITSLNYTELEWILTTQSPAADTNYFEFRSYVGDTALSGAYTVTPKWTISSGAGLSIPVAMNNYYRQRMQ